jgi:hypothetical protein
MGATLLLGGSCPFSIDNGLATKPWFRWVAGSLPLPLTDIGFRNLTLAVLAFDIGTYSYYRGSVLTPFHVGPVSPTKHDLALSEATLPAEGGVQFHVYLAGGIPEAPVHVVAADLLDSNKRPVAHWDTATSYCNWRTRQLHIQTARHGRQTNAKGAINGCKLILVSRDDEHHPFRTWAQYRSWSWRSWVQRTLLHACRRADRQ